MRSESNADDTWTIEDSRDLYLIEGWGAPYFDVNDAGHVCVRPNPNVDQVIDIHELVDDLRRRDLDLPLLIRFPEILRHRIEFLNECFAAAIEQNSYDGRYRGVFPIKVNQQRHFIEEVVRAGRDWNFGLEAGSKPELLIALAMMEDEDGFIVCNGYKDRAFIETALIAQQFDNEVVIVLERPDELEIVRKASEKLQVRPKLGVRTKLASKGKGRWADSSGDNAKFGLTSAQLVALVDQLAEHDMLDCLELLHFHVGSQVSSIKPWRNVIREAAQVYVELQRLGCKMGYLDVGGGLAVDYDGTKTDSGSSMNYHPEEYAWDIVNGIMSVCDENDVEHPVIVSESGRAIAAHQSILVFDAVSEADDAIAKARPPADDAPRVLSDLWEVYGDIHASNVQESYAHAQQALEESRSLFRFGYLDLRDTAHAEDLFWACCARIHAASHELDHIPPSLEPLAARLGTMYYCNFSVFQSAPDSWAMEQIFPIVPLGRLDERPTEKAQLADLTCDSDGLIDAFISVDGTKRALDVHPVRPDENYLLGMFLVGAYQEILGDLHNLFGDTNAAQIRTQPNGYSVSEVIRGDTVGEVLRHVQYDTKEMVERVRLQAERSVQAGRMPVEQLRTLMRHYENALRSYTYLTPDS